MVETRSGHVYVGDTVKLDEFGVQVMRLSQPYGPRVPYRDVFRRGYFKVGR